MRGIKAKHLPGTTISDQVPGRHESQPLSRRPGGRGGGREVEGGGWKGVLLPYCHSKSRPCLQSIVLPHLAVLGLGRELSIL